MKREETYCDSCKKRLDGHVDNQKLRFKVESVLFERLYGGWIWQHLDLCRGCFAGLKIVWEDKCREIEMRVNGKPRGVTVMSADEMWGWLRTIFVACAALVLIGAAWTVFFKMAGW